MPLILITMPWENAPLMRLPPDYRGMVLAYVEFGRPPDALLTAVLSNDLIGYLEEARTLEASDPEGTRRGPPPPSMRLISVLIAVLNEAPPRCWGSPERVRGWVRHGGLRGHRGS